jgi:hypothetical protein
MQAYCCRALDFSQARRYDARWSLKRDIVLNKLELDNIRQLKMLHHLTHCGGMARGTHEAYEHHFEKATEEVRGIGQLLFPYANWNQTEVDEKYKKLWEEWFGFKVGSKQWQEMEHRGELLRQWLQNRKE